MAAAEDSIPLCLIPIDANKFKQINDTFGHAEGDAGYDIVDNLDGVLTHFDAVIGLDRLKAIHFNDSKNERGSRKDRHEKLGQGRIYCLKASTS